MISLTRVWGKKKKKKDFYTAALLITALSFFSFWNNFLSPIFFSTS